MTETLLSKEEQVLFFLPAVESYTEQLEMAFSKKGKQMSSEHEWFFIIDEKESGKFPKHYIMEKIWDEFVFYLKSETKLYCFVEEQAAGLAAKKSKYWLFFSPKTANDYFTGMLDIPKGFNLKTIITIPFMNLLDPLVEHINLILEDGKSTLKTKIFEANNLLNLALFYLTTEKKVDFDIYFRPAISFYLLSEVQLLMKDIHSPTLSPAIIQKRLQCAFKICWRYFRTRNELEATYYKKMISPTNDEVIKGLKLAEKKITDFRAAKKL